MDEQHAATRRLVAYIHREALRRTFVSVAEEVGLAESTVRRIFGEHAYALDAARQVVMPDWLGIDEIHLAGKPRCVLTNVRQRTMLDLLRDRHRSTDVAFLQGLPDKQRVELVAMDMWRPYKEAVNLVPLRCNRCDNGPVSAAEIDAYLQALEEPKRGTLTRLRETILDIVPDAEQGISYGTPAFKVRGKAIAGFAAFKNHLSYLPHSGSVFPELSAELTGYSTSSGALRFDVDTPLPRQLVQRLIDVRLRQAFGS
jgi:uncharacterized protein YdhG (YjbR/CyaY superfamily)